MRNKNAHEKHHRYNRTHAGIPRAMFDDLFRALLGVPGLLASVASRETPAKLDTSVGVPGPHGFVERVRRLVIRAFRVHRNPPHVP